MKNIRRITAMVIIVAIALMMGAALAATIKVTSPMHIRTGAGVKYRSVDVVNAGKVLRVKKASSSDGTLWFRITAGRYKGRYISSQHTTTTYSPVDVWVKTTSTANFRKSPTTSSRLMRKFGRGAVLHCTGYRNGWFRIRYNGKTGYIYGYNLKPA